MATWAQGFEAVMLLCFGISWPASILRTYRAKSVAGKSLLFLSLIFTGYLAGIAAKLIRASHQGGYPEWVTGLYALNALLVGADIALYLRYSKPEHTTRKG
jgi:urea transporter